MQMVKLGHYSYTLSRGRNLADRRVDMREGRAENVLPNFLILYFNKFLNGSIVGASV